MSRSHKKVNMIRKANEAKINGLSKDEVRAQVRAVEQLYLFGHSVNEMPELLAKQNIDVTVARCESLVEQIKQRLVEDTIRNKSHNKARQIRRVESYIRLARHQGKLKDLATFENLYADLAGTKEPIRISVDVRITQTLQDMLSQMTDEDIQYHLDRARERERNALAYVQAMQAGKLLPEPETPIVKTNMIDVCLVGETKK